MTYYTHRYTTLTDYEVVEHHDNGFSRVVDPHNEEKWVAAGNIPEKTSGDRFILIDGDRVITDPNKDVILAVEEDARLAADKKALDISAAKERVKSISADCEEANDINALKMIVLDLVNQLKVLIT